MKIKAYLMFIIKQKYENAASKYKKMSLEKPNYSKKFQEYCTAH